MNNEFEKSFLDYANKLNNLSTFEERERYASELVDKYNDAVNSSLAPFPVNEELDQQFLAQLDQTDDIDQQFVSQISADKPIHFSLTLEKYQKLKNARDSQIESELTNLMKNLHQIKTQIQCHENSLEDIGKEMLKTGFWGIGPVTLSSLYSEVKSPVLGEIKSKESRIVNSLGLSSRIVSVLESIISFISVSAITNIIGGESSVMMFIFNELDSELVNVNSEAIHGEIITTTNPIPGIKMDSNQSKIISGGLFIGKKYHYGPFGAQVGWQFNSKGHQVSFASDCPTTSFLTYNNCYCGFDIDAREAAKLTDKFDKQYFFASSSDGAAEIRVHSKYGSPAYNIGRIYNPNAE